MIKLYETSAAPRKLIPSGIFRRFAGIFLETIFSSRLRGERIFGLGLQRGIGR
jgi:hypothetical protein